MKPKPRTSSNHPLLDRIAERFHPRVIRCRYQDGDVILREGEHGTAVYFLEEGSLVVEHGGSVGGPGHLLKVLANRSGSDQLVPFGEMSQFTDGRRSATIRSAGGSTVMKIDADVFPVIYAEFPEIARTLNLKLVERLRDSNERLRELSSRLEPLVERIVAEEPMMLLKVGEPADYLWQCVAGRLFRMDVQGVRTLLEPDDDGFVEPFTFFAGGDWNCSVEAQPGSFLVRWPGGDFAAEPFRFHPKLALRLLRERG